jgi:hypothetical protein
MFQITDQLGFPPPARAPGYPAIPALSNEVPQPQPQDVQLHGAIMLNQHSYTTSLAKNEYSYLTRPGY